MKIGSNLKKILIFVIVAGLIITAWVVYSFNSVSIKSIQLTSPNNYAFQEDVTVELNRDESIFVKYWKKGSPEKFRTVSTAVGTNHTVRLLLLETNTTYNYQVIIDKLIDVPSKVFSFNARNCP